MIENGHKIIKSFRCSHSVMEYLVYEANIAILSYDNQYYYFALTDKLKTALKNMPLHLKVLASFIKQEGGTV